MSIIKRYEWWKWFNEIDHHFSIEIQKKIKEKWQRGMHYILNEWKHASCTTYYTRHFFGIHFICSGIRFTLYFKENHNLWHFGIFWTGLRNSSNFAGNLWDENTHSSGNVSFNEYLCRYFVCCRDLTTFNSHIRKFQGAIKIHKIYVKMGREWCAHVHTHAARCCCLVTEIKEQIKL